MDLKDICLREVSEQEFVELKDYWGVPCERRGNTTPVRIVSTLEYPDHETLIRDFLEHEYADKISVREQDRWIKRLVRDIKKNRKNDGLYSEIQRLAEIAQSDLRQGYIELYFSTGHYDDIDRNTRICFRNLDDDRLIGHSVNSRYMSYDLFSWAKLVPKSHAILGLWAPAQTPFP